MAGLLDKCGVGSGADCDNSDKAGGNYKIDTGDVENKKGGKDLTQAQILSKTTELALKTPYDVHKKPDGAKVPNDAIVNLTKMLNGRNNDNGMETFVGRDGGGTGMVLNVSSRKGDIVVVLVLVFLLFWWLW